MSLITEATFDGNVFRPDGPLELLSDTRYRLTIEPLPPHNEGDAWDLLAGAVGSVVAPPDWAEQHDRYLSGTPMLSEEKP